MIVKVVQIRDVAIIEADLAPCADVFIFKAVENTLEICGGRYVLSGDIGVFRKGLLILKKTPFLFECDDGMCVAAKTQV